jgi:hypothetical protein
MSMGNIRVECRGWMAERSRRERKGDQQRDRRVVIEAVGRVVQREELKWERNGDQGQGERWVTAAVGGEEQSGIDIEVIQQMP